MSAAASTSSASSNDVYQRYGFEPLETPALENIETLTGKYGEEGNKLIFKVLRRGEHEASGETDLALRYDLTVPLARVVAEHRGKLPRFFKRYQIQPVWRADRPARGRFREFYQCDVDAIGSRSPVVEAESVLGGQRRAAAARVRGLRHPSQPSRAAAGTAGRRRACQRAARHGARRHRQARQDRARRRGDANCAARGVDPRRSGAGWPRGRASMERVTDASRRTLESTAMSESSAGRAGGRSRACRSCGTIVA